MHSNSKISFIIPVFNEEQNLVPLYTTLNTIIHTQLSAFSYEYIFVDDGSHDSSWLVLQRLAQCDAAVKAFQFTRNFGHQAALTAGYQKASGDLIISLDADMQDPPETIVAMIEHWKRGAAIVYARRRLREDGFLKRITAQLFYALLDHVSDVRMPRNVGDFRLIDKKVLAIINQCPERARYLRGMVAWTGFNYAFVDFDRPERAAGVTGYTWKKMFKLAFDGLTSFSLFPLKIAAFLGSLVVITGSLMFVYITCDTFFFGKHYPLFKWLVTALYIFMGVQFFLLWLLGEYIGRMYDQIKQRPFFIVNQELGNDQRKPKEKSRVQPQKNELEC